MGSRSDFRAMKVLGGCSGCSEVFGSDGVALLKKSPEKRSRSLDAGQVTFLNELRLRWGLFRCVELLKRKRLVQRKLNSDTGRLRGSVFRFLVRVRSVQALKLSEDRLLPILIRIERVWVEIKGRDQRIQDL